MKTKGFIKIPARFLRANDPLACSIHLFLSRRGKLLALRRENDTLDPTEIEHYKAKGLVEIYVPDPESSPDLKKQLDAGQTTNPDLGAFLKWKLENPKEAQAFEEADPAGLKKDVITGEADPDRVIKEFETGEADSRREMKEFEVEKLNARKIVEALSDPELRKKLNIDFNNIELLKKLGVDVEDPEVQAKLAKNEVDLDFLKSKGVDLASPENLEAMGIDSSDQETAQLLSLDETADQEVANQDATTNDSAEEILLDADAINDPAIRLALKIDLNNPETLDKLGVDTSDPEVKEQLAKNAITPEFLRGKNIDLGTAKNLRAIDVNTQDPEVRKLLNLQSTQKKNKFANLNSKQKLEKALRNPKELKELGVDLNDIAILEKLGINTNDPDVKARLANKSVDAEFLESKGIDLTSVENLAAIGLQANALKELGADLNDPVLLKKLGVDIDDPEVQQRLSENSIDAEFLESKGIDLASVENLAAIGLQANDPRIAKILKNEQAGNSDSDPDIASALKAPNALKELGVDLNDPALLKKLAVDIDDPEVQQRLSENSIDAEFLESKGIDLASAENMAAMSVDPRDPKITKTLKRDKTLPAKRPGINLNDPALLKKLGVDIDDPEVQQRLSENSIDADFLAAKGIDLTKPEALAAMDINDPEAYKSIDAQASQKSKGTKNNSTDVLAAALRDPEVLAELGIDLNNATILKKLGVNINDPKVQAKLASKSIDADFLKSLGVDLSSPKNLVAMGLRPNDPKIAKILKKEKKADQSEPAIEWEAQDDSPGDLLSALKKPDTLKKLGINLNDPALLKKLGVDIDDPEVRQKLAQNSIDADFLTSKGIDLTAPHSLAAMKLDPNQTDAKRILQEQKNASATKSLKANLNTPEARERLGIDLNNSETRKKLGIDLENPAVLKNQLGIDLTNPAVASKLGLNPKDPKFQEKLSAALRDPAALQKLGINCNDPETVKKLGVNFNNPATLKRLGVDLKDPNIIKKLGKIAVPNDKKNEIRFKPDAAEKIEEHRFSQGTDLDEVELARVSADKSKKIENAVVAGPDNENHSNTIISSDENFNPNQEMLKISADNAELSDEKLLVFKGDKENIANTIIKAYEDKFAKHELKLRALNPELVGKIELATNALERSILDAKADLQNKIKNGITPEPGPTNKFLFNKSSGICVECQNAKIVREVVYETNEKQSAILSQYPAGKKPSAAEIISQTPLLEQIADSIKIVTRFLSGHGVDPRDRAAHEHIPQIFDELDLNRNPLENIDIVLVRLAEIKNDICQFFDAVIENKTALTSLFKNEKQEKKRVPETILKLKADQLSNYVATLCLALGYSRQDMMCDLAVASRLQNVPEDKLASADLSPFARHVFTNLDTPFDQLDFVSADAVQVVNLSLRYVSHPDCIAGESKINPPLFLELINEARASTDAFKPDFLERTRQFVDRNASNNKLQDKSANVVFEAKRIYNDLWTW